MVLALFAISSYICVVDIKSHLITNRALVCASLTFLSLSALTQWHVHPLTGLLVIFVAPLILMLGIGAGDIKLLILLTFFFIPFSWKVGTEFLLSFSFICLALLAERLVRSHSLAGSIALAPAICGAVIWCAR
jgi:Flp pilus assembly protein protease CpaA